TLFDGRRFSDLASARANVTAAEANEVAARYRIALDVKIAYYNALAARESESAARAELEQAEQQQRAASARVRAGSATMSDSLRSIIAVGNARLAVLTAQNAVRTSSAALTRLVASPVPVTASATDTLERISGTPLDPTQVMPLAENSPLVEQAEAQYAAAQSVVRGARGNYLPTIDLNYRRAGSGFDPAYGFAGGQLAHSNTWSIGVSLPVFNNFAREDQLTRARVQEDIAEANRRDARFLSRQNLIQQIGVLRTAETRVQIQQASVAAAEEDVRVQQQRYNLGASTLLDLLTSQSSLNSARSALIQARLDYRTARAQIEAIIGQDLP
nr:TolC family protein [Gemmatimonadaceae bacterium]